MVITTEIIYEEICRSYAALLSLKHPNTTLCSPMFYDGSALSRNHIYIVQPEQLAFVQEQETQIAFICAGVSGPPENPPDCNVIYIKENLDPYRILNLLTGIFDSYNRWEASVNECNRDYDGIQKILNLSSRILDGALLLVDFHFNLVAYSRNLNAYNDFADSKYRRKIPFPIIDDLLKDPEFTENQYKRDVFQYPSYQCEEVTLCYNLFRSNETVYSGRLMLMRRPAEYSPKHRYLLQYLGALIDPVFEGLSPFDLPLPVYDNLRETIHNLLTKNLRTGGLITAVLERVNWKLTDRYQMIKMIPLTQESNRDIHPAVCSQLEMLFREAYATLYEGNIVLLINMTRAVNCAPYDLRKTLSVYLRENMLKAGISNVFADFTMLKNAYMEASAALELGNCKNDSFWCYFFSDYTLDYIVEECSKALAVENLCHQSLLILREHDTKHHSEYILTLKSFLMNKYNVTHTANALYIHRTTLLNRLEKIVELTSLDLEDWNTRLHLMLSFYMLKW